MKFCKKCGEEIDDNTVFCPNCGENIMLINGVSQEKSLENLSELAETVNENTDEVCEEDDFDEEKERAKLIAASKRKTVLRKIILVFAIILIGGLFGVVSNLDSFDSDYSEPLNNGTGSNAVQYGDTSGTVVLKYCMIDLQTYNTLSQLNSLNLGDSQFIEFGNLPWRGGAVTLSTLSGFAAQSLASKQGNQVVGQYTLAIKVLETVAYGSANFSAMGTSYRLVGLYINGEAASPNAYMNDGDEIKAVIVYIG